VSLAQVLALVAAVLLAALVIHFRAESRGVRQRVSQRLAVGAGGVITGAEGFELAGGERAVLLVHGFGDTPQTLRLLGAWLQREGWTVSAPLLPGHGRTIDDFARSGADEWLAAARTHFRELCGRHAHVAVVGLSMGGAIATILAAAENRVEALVLLAPYLTMPRGIRRLTRVAPLWNFVTPVIETHSDKSILDASARRDALGYGASTPRLLAELGRVAETAFAVAPRVHAPTLMVHSRSDNRVPADVAQRVFDRFTASSRDLVWLSTSGHVITVDRERERVFAAVSEWLAAHVPAATGRPRAPADGSNPQAVPRQ
jgi:carboxylesterase